MTIAPRMPVLSFTYCFFFFNDTCTSEIYTLSLHDALPIYRGLLRSLLQIKRQIDRRFLHRDLRSEEHTSELQSLTNLVCRLLLEKKKSESTPYRCQRESCETTSARPDALARSHRPHRACRS